MCSFLAGMSHKLQQASFFSTDTKSLCCSSSSSSANLLSTFEQEVKGMADFLGRLGLIFMPQNPMGNRQLNGRSRIELSTSIVQYQPWCLKQVRCLALNWSCTVSCLHKKRLNSWRPVCISFPENFPWALCCYARSWEFPSFMPRSVVSLWQS